MVATLTAIPTAVVGTLTFVTTDATAPMRRVTFSGLPSISYDDPAGLVTVSDGNKTVVIARNYFVSLER